MGLPKTFFGAAASGKIWEADVDEEDDDGETIQSGGKTNRLAPAGPRGECVFAYLGLTFAWKGGPWTVTVLPIIDEVVGVLEATANGKTLLGRQIELPDAGDERVHDTFEIPIIETYRRGGKERLRNHPRGRWVQVDIRWEANETVIVDNVDIEYEIVRETQKPQDE